MRCVSRTVACVVCDVQPMVGLVVKFNVCHIQEAYKGWRDGFTRRDYIAFTLFLPLLLVMAILM